MRRAVLAFAFLLAMPSFAQTIYLDFNAIHYRRQRNQDVKRMQRTYTCGIRTVGWRFIGEPGTQFSIPRRTFLWVTYHRWTIEKDGDIELIRVAGDLDHYRIDGRDLPLNVWPHNQYGFREVPVPRNR